MLDINDYINLLNEVINYNEFFKKKIKKIQPLNDIHILHNEFNGYNVKCEDQR